MVTTIKVVLEMEKVKENGKKKKWPYNLRRLRHLNVSRGRQQCWVKALNNMI